MSRTLSPAMRQALMDIELLGHTPAEAARRNGVKESGISRQLNKPKPEHCKECGQIVKVKK
jgi:DNA-directed RNA polymerase specialized sigma24 family protein